MISTNATWNIQAQMMPTPSALDLARRYVALLYSSEWTDMDDELRAWLQESHDIVGLQIDLRGKARYEHDLAAGCMIN
jgi:hypothetical protein